MRELFPGRTLRSPLDIGLDPEVLEDGNSFLANAMIKAEALGKLYRGPVLADDSGLCVDALGGAPGIYSARYGSDGGIKLDSSARNAFLLSKMEGQANRRCRFVCCLVLRMDAERVFSAQETMEGELLLAPRGAGGFGYDPIVRYAPSDKSVAELSSAEKHEISHRGRAARRIAAILDSLDANP